MTVTAETPAAFPPSRAMPIPPWARPLVLALFYGVGVPLAKGLELFGQWPGMLSGLRARAEARMAAGKDAGRGMIFGFGDYRPSAHDVIACSYFKSGTNWLMQMTTQIAGRGRAEFEHIHDVVPWPDGPGSGTFYSIGLDDETPWRASPTGLRVIKYHGLAKDVPYTEEARYVVVVRDPKSVCVSSYHFAKATIFGPMMPRPVNWAEFFLRPGFALGDWADHVAGWWALRDRPNVLFLTYEEMVKDHPAAVRRLAAFMGVDLTPDELDAAILRSSFAYMKPISGKFDFMKITPWARPEGSMIRRGQHGASGELLSPQMQSRIDAHFRAELKRLDCDFPYDEAFGVGG